MFRLDRDEHIEILKRKHWFILLAEAFGPIVLLALPFIVYPIVSGMEVSLGSDQSFLIELPPVVLTFLGAAWALILWMRLAHVWTDYYLDLWIVTDKRIIDIDQKGLFHRETSTFRIERIQDITVEVQGIIATLLNYGTIHVQTAGEMQEFLMRGIARPRYVRQVIMDLQERVAKDADGV